MSRQTLAVQVAALAEGHPELKKLRADAANTTLSELMRGFAKDRLRNAVGEVRDAIAKAASVSLKNHPAGVHA